MYSGLAALVASIGLTLWSQQRYKVGNVNNNTTLQLPVIDLQTWFNKDQDEVKFKEECKKLLFKKEES